MSKLFDEAERVYNESTEERPGVMVYNGKVLPVEVEEQTDFDTHWYDYNKNLKVGLVICGVITIGTVTTNIINYCKRRYRDQSR